MATKYTGTVEEAAEILGISRNSAYEAAREGQIPVKRIGRRIIVLWGPFMRMVGTSDDAVA